MKKKLAVIFPGVGYTCAKPLLYYTAQLAGEYGYEVLRLDYGDDIHKFRGRTMDDLIPLTVPYLESAEGCFVAGTGDPYISGELVEEIARKYPGKTGKVFARCNHSLEKPGDTAGNLKNLQETLEILRKMLD